MKNLHLTQHFTFGFTILASVMVFLMPDNADAKTNHTVSDLIAKLDDQDTKAICNALEHMGRLCDQSCIPYINDMLRHDDPDVIKAACHAAVSLANPRLAPALYDIIAHHPVNEVRQEALKALIKIGRPEDYRYLINSMEIAQDHIDELASQIIRVLPENQINEMADKFAKLSARHQLTTSIVHAYRNHPDVLFDAIIRLVSSCSNTNTRYNYFRALSLINSRGLELPSNVYNIFDDISDNDIQIVAIIQANRSTPDAIRWLLTHGDRIRSHTLIDVLTRLSDDAAMQILDSAIASHDTFSKSYNIYSASSSVVQNLMVARMGKTKNAKILAYLLMKQKNTSPDAIRLIANNLHSDNTREFIIQQLGNADQNVAMTAMRIISNSHEYDTYLADLILSSPTEDNGGAVYLARWALAISAKKDKIPLEIKNKILADARKCFENPKRLHAEPAIWLHIALDTTVPVPSQKEFNAMRSDMKSAILHSLGFSKNISNKAASILSMSLADKDDTVISEALLTIAEHLDMAKQIDEIEEMVEKYIQSDNPSLSVNALRLAGKLQMTSLIPVIQEMMSDDDDRIVYNAIWALQKMRALPDNSILSVIYFRTSLDVLRERLGFLTGIDKNARELFPMSELLTHKPISKNTFMEFASGENTYSHHDITIVHEDQSIAVLHTNLMGFVYIP